MRRFIAPLVLLLTPGLALGVIATPATGTEDASGVLTFPAQADATILAGSPSANFGSTDELLADRSPGEESLLRFDVQGVGTVREATLRLYATNGSSDGPKVYGVQNGWQESTVTWDTKPQRIGRFAVDDAAAVPTGSWLELDVTSLVGGNGPVSLNLAPTSSDGIDLSSREALANPPELVVRSVAGGGATDETAPETALTGGPSGTTEDTAAALAFTADELADFECRLDGGPWAACTSPARYADLEEGLHSFHVRATDAAGNTDPTPANWIWTIDPASVSRVLTLPAKADAAVLAGSPSTNYGTTEELLADATPLQESLLRFDVQGLDGPAWRAILRLYPTSSSAYGPEVHGAANDWEETTVTWDDRPRRVGAAVAEPPRTVSAGTWLELDVTSLVVGNGPLSLVLAPRSNDGADFNSREASTHRPQLVVTPERGPDPSPTGPVVRESVATVENTTQATSMTVDRPAGAAPGDVLVACLAVNRGVVVVPPGWRAMGDIRDWGRPDEGGMVHGYYRVVETDEPESWTWRMANRRGDLELPSYPPGSSYSPWASVGIARYSGVGFIDVRGPNDRDFASPLDGLPVRGGGRSGTSVTVPGPTTTAAGSKLVGCLAINSSKTDVTITPPAGMDPAWDLGGKRQQLSDIDLGAAGQSPDRTWEISSPRESAGWLIALRAG